MPILENATDFSSGDQLTPGTLNALTESAKFVKTGAGVTNSGNTTDETSCNINSSGEIEVKDLGISNAKLAADCVTGAKIADDSVDSEHYVDGSIDNAHLAPTSGTAAVAGSGTGATGTNVIEAASIGFADLNADTVNGQTELSAAPADADELLIYDDDASALKKLGIDSLMKHPAIPKAYGTVDLSVNPVTIAGAYGCTLNGGTQTAFATIDLNAAMSDQNYVVSVTEEGSADKSNAPAVEIVSDQQFKVHKSSNSTLHFVVFGTLA